MSNARILFVLLGILVLACSFSCAKKVTILWGLRTAPFYQDPSAFSPNPAEGICEFINPSTNLSENVFCLAVNRLDEVRWFTGDNETDAFGIQATDDAFAESVLTYEDYLLPDDLIGDTLSTPGLARTVAYTFRASGIFFFRDPNVAEHSTMKGWIEVSTKKASSDDDEDDGVALYGEILSWIVLILLYLSIVGALLTIFTFALFKSIRTYPIKLIMYLCVCIIIGNLWFVLAFEDVFIQDGGLCYVTGLIVHGFFLANLCWTFCIAFNFYQMIVRRNRESESLEKYYHLFSWGFPVFCVIFVSSFQEYGDQGGACYIKNTIFIFVFFFLPGLIIVSSNSILFFFVIREIHETLASAPKTDKREKKKEVRVYLSIFISIGLSWIFGFLMVLFQFVLVIRLIFLTLFSIFTPLQGFFIFISYCLNYKVFGKYAGLFGKVIPFCRRWENLDSRSTTSTGRTGSSARSQSRTGRSSRSAATRSIDTQDMSMSSDVSRSVRTDLYGDDDDETANDDDVFKEDKDAEVGVPGSGAAAAAGGGGDDNDVDLLGGGDGGGSDNDSDSSGGGGIAF